MSKIQHILVCAQDSVLAKKVRFLLARDECEVEILSKPSQLERRLRELRVALLILSRSLDGEDAVELLSRFDSTLMIPATIVLGGQGTETPDFITIIPDPIDTQAIYRIASEVLVEVAKEESTGSDEDLTHISIDPPQEASREPHTDPNRDLASLVAIPEHRKKTREDEISFSDVTGLDEIAGKLDLLESADSMLNDAFDVGEKQDNPGHSPGANPRKQKALPPGKQEPAILGGLLEPARFAKALFQCWSKQVTGALIVARDHETLTIHFENGSPVHVESSIPGDQLGRSLVNRGRITEAQYADGAKRAIERGLRLGQALVELAFFTNQELGRELGTTARDQIVGCFAARQGAFEFDAKRKVPTDERPYSIAVGHVLSDGIKRHCDQTILKDIVGDIDGKYFKLNRSVEELHKRFPFEAREIAFLDFSGRAYNVADAAEVSGLDLILAHKLMALLMTCEEVQDFTPGVREFEARIAEERQRSRDLDASRARKDASDEPKPRIEPIERRTEDREAGRRSPDDARSFGERRGFDRTAGDEALHNPPLPPAGPISRKTPKYEAPFPPSPPPPPLPSSMLPPSATPPHASAPPNGDSSIPPMPVPAEGEIGMAPRPLVYAKPLPRGTDGTPLETQERTLSREHFQRGVTLLGQGNFASAEEAFRDAVALCSEEHVYLIGLARAIYYNPGYRADGKVPVLKAIVGRAEQLAPDDNRVATLSTWIQTAEAQLRS